MYTASIVVSIVATGIAGLLFMLWFVPFCLLMRRIRKQHARYYAAIGRPYTHMAGTDISQRDDTHKPKLRLAYWRTLSEVYTGVSRSFLNDVACQRLAQSVRYRLHIFIPLSLIVLLIILPVAGFAFALSLQPDIHIAQEKALPKQPNYTYTFKDDPTIQSTGNSIVIVTKTDEIITDQRTLVLTPLDNSKISRPIDISQVSKATSGTTQYMPLTRADLTAVLAGIAPVGQKHARKQDICKQLLAQMPIATNLGPSGAICTDANLTNYSSY